MAPDGPTLAGRVALVTGGNRGIGAAIAQALATDGADVAINYRKDDESAAATAKEIEAIGGHVRNVCSPLTTREDERWEPCAGGVGPA